MTLGLYAGSFDPLHLGHLRIIEAASRMCDELAVVATGNPDKHGAFFSLPERTALIGLSTIHLPNVRPMSHSGLTVELAAVLGASFLVRGVRTESRVEMEMAAINLRVSGIPTLFFPADAASAWISSSQVRSVHRQFGPDAVAGMVPDAVLERLRSDLVSG